MATAPRLGYGKQTEASIDQANIAMRGMPWYQEQMRQWGQDPGHPNLSKSQSQQILKQAQANGYVVDEGNMEVDDHGNFNPIGHKLRNSIIVGGLAAAAVLTGGAALGAYGAGAGSGTAAGLAGVEGGAYGLGSGALASLGTGAMGAGAAAAGGSGFLAAAGASPLASTTIGTGSIPAITGGTGMASGGGGIMDALKSAYDIYNKAKPIVNAITSRDAGPSTASTVGQTAGSIEQQRMNALIQQAKLQQEQDALGLSRTNAGVNVGNLDLAQKKAALSAPGTLASQSVRGDVLANSQDASFSGLNPKIRVPTMSGGLRPSMLSDSSRALGGQMSRNALADSTSGKFTTQAPLPTVPTATPLPEAGAFDKILQGGAIGGGFLDALKGIGGKGSAGVTGMVPGNITNGDIPIDPEAGVSAEGSAEQFAGMPGASGMPEAPPPNPEQTAAGIDPAILEWLKQQADPMLANGGDHG